MLDKIIKFGGLQTLRKYITLLMIMTVVGAGLTIFLLFRSNLVVFINNDTDEEITDLTLTYEGIKEEITVPPIKPNEYESIKINPKKQAEESFNGASLELHYKDDSGKAHSEIVFDHFETGQSGDAEVTITDKDEKGVFTIEIDDEIY